MPGTPPPAPFPPCRTEVVGLPPAVAALRRKYAPLTRGICVTWSCQAKSATDGHLGRCRCGTTNQHCSFLSRCETLLSHGPFEPPRTLLMAKCATPGGVGLEPTWLQRDQKPPETQGPCPDLRGTCIKALTEAEDFSIGPVGEPKETPTGHPCIVQIIGWPNGSLEVARRW